MITKPISFRQLKLLSCYLDGQLNSRQAAKLEKKLAQDAELREKLFRMRQMRLLIRQLKPKKVSRNFILKPEMFAAFRKQTPASRWLPAFSYSTLAAAVMMIIVLVGRFIPLGMMASEIPAELAAKAPIMETEDAVVSREADRPLQLITWGNAPTMTNEVYVKSGAGGMGGGLGGGEDLTTNADIALIGPPAQVTNSSGVIGFTLILPREDAAIESKQPTEAALAETPEPYTVINSGPVLGLRISNEMELPRAEEPAISEKTLQIPWLIVGLGGLTLLLGITTFSLWLKTRRV